MVLYNINKIKKKVDYCMGFKYGTPRRKILLPNSIEYATEMIWECWNLSCFGTYWLVLYAAISAVYFVELNKLILVLFI